MMACWLTSSLLLLLIQTDIRPGGRWNQLQSTAMLMHDSEALLREAGSVAPLRIIGPSMRW